MRELYSTHLAGISGILIVGITLLFALIQSPEIVSAPESALAKDAQPIAHPLEGYEGCHGCHGLKGKMPYPVKHLGWSNTSCTRCHSPSS